MAIRHRLSVGGGLALTGLGMLAILISLAAATLGLFWLSSKAYEVSWLIGLSILLTAISFGLSVIVGAITMLITAVVLSVRLLIGVRPASPPIPEPRTETPAQSRASMPRRAAARRRMRKW